MRSLLVLIFAFFPFFSTASELKLALNWKPEPQFGGFYQAQETGEFKRQNLEVKILEGGSGTPTIQMLANSQIEYGIVSAEEVLINNDKNPKNKVVAIFATYQTNPQMIMAHPEKGFKTIADILKSNGTLAMQAGLSYAQFLKQKYGSLKVKIVPYQGGIAQFLNDPNYSQQGFATSEPLLVEKEGKKAQVFLVADEGFNPYTTVVAVSESRLKKSPDEVKKMVVALRNGWTSYLMDPKLANQKMATLNKAMDFDSFTKSAFLQVQLIQPKSGWVGVMTNERWSDLISQMRSLGLIKENLKPNEQFTNLN